MANDTETADQLRSTNGVVYFFGLRNRRIKIGTTTRPDARLRELRSCYMRWAPMLAQTPGGVELERQYHARFAQHRHGKTEWFDPAPEILAEIDRITAENCTFLEQPQ